MSLYMVQFDSVQRYVEAANMPDAIAVWRSGMLAENVNAAHNGGWEGNEDPEQVVLINDEPVIRARPADDICSCRHARSVHTDGDDSNPGDYCKQCGCAIFERAE